MVIATIRYHFPFFTGSPSLLKHMTFILVAYVVFGVICLFTIYLGYRVIKEYDAKTFIGNFAFGLLYGAGLMLGGIARPSIVLGFFAWGKEWNPAAGIFLGFTLIFLQIIFKFFGRHPPELDSNFTFPVDSRIDRDLIIGSLIYGLGWGLSGLSIGPAMANLLVSDKIVIYIASMILGGGLFELYSKKMNKVQDSKTEAFLKA